MFTMLTLFLSSKLLPSPMAVLLQPMV